MSGAPGITISLHLLGITSDGRVWHTSQPEGTYDSEGAWQTWEEVKAPGSHQPGPFIHVDCVSTETADGKEELYVLGITQDAKLWYTSRVEGQNWQPFVDLGTRIGGGWNFRHVAVTEAAGQIDMCVVVSVEHGAQRILHTRRPAGKTTWEQFEEITRPDLAGFPGSFISVDCAYTGSYQFAMLHVCGVTSDGKLWHTIHFANPTWLPFVNVQFLSKNGPSSFANVSLAQLPLQLDVCAQAGGKLWHTARPERSLPLHWQSTFDNISQQTSDTRVFGSIGCSYFNGTLHICGVTDDGKLWLTWRSSENPSIWQPFEDLTTGIGNPGHFVFACLSGPTTLNAPSAGGPGCPDIQMSLTNDNFQMQALQMQAASTTNNAMIAQINQQIAGLQKNIASLRQQARDRNC
ncbi:MAG TPA: hypothetical protein VFA10_28095 [Ktedonobacteraceae bacterium]|nr:hypothetical protein [Ktedonobacteraceae bacterium]